MERCSTSCNIKEMHVQTVRKLLFHLSHWYKASLMLVEMWELICYPLSMGGVQTDACLLQANFINTKVEKAPIFLHSKEFINGYTYKHLGINRYRKLLGRIFV